MTAFYFILALFLLLNLMAAMTRIIRGPRPEDRLMTGQLFGSTGVAILLLLAEAIGAPELRDVALVFALLAVLIVICFVRTAGPAPGEERSRTE